MPLSVKKYPSTKLLPGLPTSQKVYTVAEVAIAHRLQLILLSESVRIKLTRLPDQAFEK